MANKEWIERQSRNAEARRAYEQERLLTWALEEVAEAMQRSGRSKADLARMLGTSRANVTQILSGQRSLTLRTLADLAWACESRVVVCTEPLRSGEYISSPARLVQPTRATLVSESEAAENDVLVSDENGALAA